MSSLKDDNYKESLNKYIWQFVGLTMLGILGGFLVYRSAEKSGDSNVLYFVVIAAGFFLAGLISFLIRFIKLRKKYNGDN